MSKRSLAVRDAAGTLHLLRAKNDVSGGSNGSGGSSSENEPDEHDALLGRGSLRERPVDHGKNALTDESKKQSGKVNGKNFGQKNEDLARDAHKEDGKHKSGNQVEQKENGRRNRQDGKASNETKNHEKNVGGAPLRKDLVEVALSSLANGARNVKLDAKKPNLAVVRVDPRLSRHSYSVIKPQQRGLTEGSFLLREAMCDCGLMQWWPIHQPLFALVVLSLSFLFRVHVHYLGQLVLLNLLNRPIYQVRFCAHDCVDVLAVLVVAL